MSYAWNKLEQAEKLDVSLSEYNDSINLFTRVLVEGCNHLLKKGLDRSYITVNEEYNGIKGKINFKDSLNNNLFKQGKAVCSFDEFTSNVIHNQILKSVLRRITKIEGIDKKLNKEVWACFHRFNGIDEIDLQINHFSHTKIHRNNSEYDLLLKVSKLIIENLVVNENNGTYSFSDFTRNEKAMAYLFEDFVRNFYTKEQSRYKVRREDIKWNAQQIDGSNMTLLPKMQTDITFEAKNHKIIMDTKYYKQTLAFNYSEKFHSNNLYQIHSYLTNIESNTDNPNNLNCDGILLYPTVQKEIDESYKINNHRIRIATVDLSQNWNTIHSRLLSILS